MGKVVKKSKLTYERPYIMTEIIQMEGCLTVGSAKVMSKNVSGGRIGEDEKNVDNYKDC
ncbi:MAG: hypothetical protein LBF27_34025 [Sphingobacterium sp.]|jgi:hypothetical protein|nr:hypothetical protein [Sphingobacterium sp.]